MKIRTTVSYLFQTEFLFQSIRDYIKLVESHIENEIEKLKVKFEETEKRLEESKEPQEYKLFVSDSLIEEFIELKVEFANRFRSSIVIQVFSLLEVTLKKFCKDHFHSNDKDYSVDDLKGSNELDKIKKYLKKSANIDLNGFKPEWEFINNFRKLRNRIVHGDSLIDSSHRDYAAVFAFSKDRFRVQMITEIEFEILLDRKEFIMEIVEVIENFISKIIPDKTSHYLR